MPRTPPSAQDGTSPGGGGSWIEAPVARALRRPEDRRLPLEAEDRSIGVRLPEKDAGVVHEVAGGEVVGAVGDHVVVAENVERVVRRKAHFVRDDLHVRVDVLQTLSRGLELLSPDVLRAVQDLPLQVRRVHDVEVDEAKRADARRREVERERRAETAGPHAQHARGLQLLLPVEADLRHDEMAGVALELLAAELAGRRCVGRRHGVSETANALSRSATRSSASSMPTASRTRLSVMPIASRSAVVSS